MDNVTETLPGEIKMVMYLISGLLIVIPILLVPKKVLAEIGKLPYLSPNWLSFWRFPMAWIGYGLYFYVSSFLGFNIIVFCYILDRIDGKVAAALDELKDPRYPGSTKTGKWLDPLIDKLTIVPLFVIFATHGLLNWWLICLLVGIESAGTMIRDPFLSKWPFKLMKDYVRKEEASGIGKWKITAQFLTLITLIPLHQEWMKFPLTIVNVMLAIICTISMASIASRLKLTKELDDAVDGITSTFDHKE